MPSSAASNGSPASAARPQRARQRPLDQPTRVWPNIVLGGSGAVTAPSLPVHRPQLHTRHLSVQLSASSPQSSGSQHAVPSAPEVVHSQAPLRHWCWVSQVLLPP